MKDFSLKFIDTMVAVVLGLGFQWWTSLSEQWQYLAFVFVYIDIVDYWMDYSSSLKKFPPKREVDIILDVAIIFALFLYIYSTQISIFYFLLSFVLLRVLDFFWLLSSKHEFHPVGSDKLFVDVWLRYDLIESVVTVAIMFASKYFNVLAIYSLLVFIVFRVLVRALASFRYKKIHFV
ncbi:MAG: hypothetical protein WC797_04190 [Candidatus Paceibacterota bacterium]|jgi:hypothetical protein